MKANKNPLKNISKKQILFYVSVLMLIVVIVPLFIISHYNFMCADDYSYIQPSIESWRNNHSVFYVLANQFKYAYDYYFNWQGTFSMEWLGSTLMVMICEKHYYICTYLTLGGMVLSEMFLFMLVGIKGLKADKYDTGIVSCWLIAMQVLFMPFPVESFYWACGSILYTVGFISNVLLYALMFIYLKHSYGSKGQPFKPQLKFVFIQIAIIIISFIVSFGNFVSAIFGFASFLCLVFAVWFRKLPHKFVITGDFLVYSAFFIINILAPGNRNRLGVSGAEETTPVKAIIKSFQASGEYIVTNLYPTVIFFLLLILPFVIAMVKNKALSGGKTFRYPVIFTVITYGLYTSQFVPTMYSLGILGAGRVLNIYRYTLFILLTLNLIYWTGWILRKVHDEHPEVTPDTFVIKKNYLITGFAVCVIALCVAGYFYGGKTVTTVSALNSLRTGQAKQYMEEYKNRVRVLTEDPSEDIALDRFSDPPYLLYFDDIKSDASEWQNLDVAIFYGKNSVWLK